VQLDESKFLKLKHNRGFATNNLREKRWVFGAYCMKNKMIYLRMVKNRKQETIFPIIQDLIIPNSIIWTDEFSVYTGGPNYNKTH
ncbi:hypothetical protein H312_03187, partial [Anncaliia algerae PRA339]